MGKINSFLLILFFLGCVQIHPKPNYSPVSWDVQQQIDLSFTPEQGVFSPSSQTLFLKEGNYIYIIKDDKKINRLGGIGYNSDNFSRLSDMKISPDGNLLVLDSFQKRIVKFDENGKWLTEFKLDNFSFPTLFAISSDETFYIYDQNRNEVFILNDLNDEPEESFGSFELENPTSLQISRDYIYLFDSNLNHTFFYDHFGSLFREVPEFSLEEKGVFFQLNSNFIMELSTNSKFAISPTSWLGANLKNGTWILWGDHKIILGKMKYETGL